MKPRLQGWSGDGRDNPAVVVPDSRRMAARANCETESPWKRKNQPPAEEGKVGGGRRLTPYLVGWASRSGHRRFSVGPQTTPQLFLAQDQVVSYLLKIVVEP